MKRKDVSAEVLERDLEVRLRDHYRAIAPTTDPQLTMRVDATLDLAGAGSAGVGARVWRRATLWRAAAVAAVVALVAAGIFVPRFLSPIGPEATTPVSGPSGSIGPAYDDAKAFPAAVDLVGRVRTGGIWAIESDYLLISTDEGATWKAGHLPRAAMAAEVLDASHAWIVSNGPADAFAATAPASGTADLVSVRETADGGRTWASVDFAAGPCASAKLTFVDSNSGFLACRANQGQGNNQPDTSIFRTSDGGATWTLQGHSDRLSLNLVASDADTLWAQPQGDSPAGVSLLVSRDAGMTWSAVPFAANDEAPANFSQGLEMDTTPLIWNGKEASFAVSLCWMASSAKPRTWFWRTTDGGATWAFVKGSRTGCIFPGQPPIVWAVTGPVLGQLFDLGSGTMTTSTDGGATWSHFDASGLPPDNHTFGWIDFADTRHGAATAFSNVSHTYVLLVTGDGGHSWQPADFSKAKAASSADETADSYAAGQVGIDFQTYATKDPASAWAMLSAYSQGQYGNEAAFAAAELQRAQTQGYHYDFAEGTLDDHGQMQGQPEPDASLLADLRSNSSISRAYEVTVAYPEPPHRLLIVAPLASTGEWRVWVVGAGSGG
jgi:hypothetical protein